MFTEDNCLKLAVVLFAPLARSFSIAVPTPDRLYSGILEKVWHELL